MTEILQCTKLSAKCCAEMILLRLAISLCAGVYFHFQLQVWEPRYVDANLPKVTHCKATVPNLVAFSLQPKPLL